jgi:type IV pilus assembly protein PilW
MAPTFNQRLPARPQSGLTLVELMVAMTVSLFMLMALVTLFVNTSRTNAEMVKTNYLIEDGRVAIQVMSEDLMHAGFWGGYLPQFDDLTYANVPSDGPVAIPNPCQPQNTWDAQYQLNSIGIAVQSDETLPSGAGCLSPLTKRAGSDVLVVRHVDTCVPGVGNCGADVAGKLYFQYPLCEQEKTYTAQSGTFNTLTFDTNASAAANAFVGAMIQTTGGSGADQYRFVTAYDAARIATVNSNWITTPDATTTYALKYVLGTTAYPLRKRDCATVADKRRFVSNLYYVSDVVQNGITVPVLMRSQLDALQGTLAQQAPVPLVDGVEAFRVVLGIDNISKSGAAVDYTTAVTWASATAKVTATNRGDGVPDQFIRCSTAAPCTVAQLANVVAVKLYVLTRSKEPTAGYTDSKTYCLSEPQANGTCAAGDTVGPFSDSYKRHVFTTSINLTNISGRRDTP